jgi:hypothetical protein
VTVVEAKELLGTLEPIACQAALHSECNFVTYSWCYVACRVTVVEAKELLGTFDGSLREYAARKLVAQGVKLRKVRLGLKKVWGVGFR